MASIGELTATVRADISGYVGPMRQVAATNAQVAQSVGEVGKSAQVFRKVQHVAVLLSAETAGLGAHVGQLVNKFGMLAGSGGIMLVVAGVIAALGLAFRKLTEDTKKHDEAIDGLVDSYKDATGAVVRLRLEEARLEMQRVERGKLTITGATSMAGIIMPTLGRTSSVADQTRAITALQQAQREYTQWLTDRHAPAEKAAAKAEKERLEGLRALGREMTQNLDLFGGPLLERNILNVQKQILQQQQLKQSLEETAEAQRQALLAGLGKAGLGDIKDRAIADQEGMIQSSQGAADAVAEAFVGQFRNHQQDFAATITSVLKSAIQEAIGKLIVQNVFAALFGLITGGASKGASGTGGWVSNLFGAPSASSAMGGPATVVVPLSAMPRALTPIEQSRDAQWQYVLTETNRALQGNNVRLATR